MTVSSANLFSNVATGKNLPIYDENKNLDPKKIVDFCHLSNQDVAKLSGVSVKSVRYEERIPVAVLERLQQIANICEIANAHFKDAEKTALWFRLPNPLLGGISPRDMVRFGRYNKLIQFLMDYQQGNVS